MARKPRTAITFENAWRALQFQWLRSATVKIPVEALVDHLQICLFSSDLCVQASAAKLHELTKEAMKERDSVR